MRYEILIETPEQNRSEEVREDAEIRPCRMPYVGAPRLDVEGACPRCGAVPFQVRGDASKAATRGTTVYCVGVCLGCLKPVGTIKAEPTTLWGEDEDRAVLQGRPRVY
jgi:hypothetical protein